MQEIDKQLKAAEREWLEGWSAENTLDKTPLAG